MAERILVAAGGTGGHIFPALAVADVLRQKGCQVDFAGTAQGLESRLVPGRGYPLHLLEMQGLRGKGWLRWLRAPVLLGRAIGQARRIIRECRSEAILGMGGYVSAPVGIAAWTLRCPLFLHEQNSVPGMSNRLLARFARGVFTGFPDSGLPGARWVGNPVRAEIAALPDPALRFAGRDGPVRILVMGGSQGARVLNELSISAFSSLPVSLQPEIWHQAGREHFPAVQAAYAEAGLSARVDPFIEDMAAALGWADLAICRAGAATVAELAATGLGAILIPFPHATDDHQAINARFLESAGAGRMLRQEALDGARLREALVPLLKDSALRLQWAEAARSLARTDAAAQVAAACMEARHA